MIFSVSLEAPEPLSAHIFACKSGYEKDFKTVLVHSFLSNVDITRKTLYLGPISNLE